MKYAQYGVPALSFVLSIGCIHSSMLLSQAIQRISRLSAVLTSLGMASMGIMYLHEPAINRLQAFHVPRWPTFALAVILSWLGTKLLERFSFTRKVFLGVQKLPETPGSERNAAECGYGLI